MVPKYRATALHLSSLAHPLHPDLSTRLFHKSLSDLNPGYNILSPNLFFFGGGAPHAIKLPLISQLLDSETWESSYHLTPHIEIKNNIYYTKCELDIIHTLSSNSTITTTACKASVNSTLHKCIVCHLTLLWSLSSTQSKRSKW